MLQQYQPVVQDVLTRAAEINSALGARAQSTIGVSKDYADHLVQQLKALAEQGRVIPGHLIEVSWPLPCIVAGTEMVGRTEDYHRPQGDCPCQGLYPSG